MDIVVERRTDKHDGSVEHTKSLIVSSVQSDSDVKSISMSYIYTSIKEYDIKAELTKQGRNISEVFCVQLTLFF